MRRIWYTVGSKPKEDDCYQERLMIKKKKGKKKEKERYNLTNR